MYHFPCFQTMKHARKNFLNFSVFYFSLPPPTSFLFDVGRRKGGGGEAEGSIFYKGNGKEWVTSNIPSLNQNKILLSDWIPFSQNLSFESQLFNKLSFWCYKMLSLKYSEKRKLNLFFNLNWYQVTDSNSILSDRFFFSNSDLEKNLR